MKAKPYKLINGSFVPCAVEEVTHIMMTFPGRFPNRCLPVITKGTRDGHERGVVWTWNGNTECPTIKPSILSSDGQGDVCHTWVTDGKVQFLNDSTHEFSGQTLNLIDVEKRLGIEDKP